MTQFSQVRDFFRLLKPGQFVTRKMYMETMKGQMRESMLDLYRCYLMRAGYIYDPTKRKSPAPLYNYSKRRDFPFGIYFISKPIPKNITLTQLLKEAYPGRK